MAIVRNGSILRAVLVLLCFSTAFLFLSLRWYTSGSMSVPASNSSNPAKKNPTNTPPVSKKLLGSSSIPTKISQTANQPVATNLKQINQKSAATSQNQLVVDLGDRRVYVYHTGKVIASYPTGVGKKGWETPLGSFKVLHKQLYPTWRHPITGQVFPPGKDSPLGDRWIGFMSDGAGEIGFHGTPDETLVGGSVSHGCLRMRNADVRMLYQQVDVGTLVEVRS
jgi:lipoprotein-anchoring transpeptidase ErfK/SrfK